MPKQINLPAGAEKKPKRPTIFDFVAPEHVRVAKSMGRDYPRDDWGHKIPGTKRELKIDPRASIQIPPRPTYTIQPYD